MMIDVRHESREVSDALHEFTHRRVTRALQSLEDAVSSVDVSTLDVERPGGGVDVTCHVNARLSSAERPVMVTGKGADAYAATLDATAHLHESVSRAVDEERRAPASVGSPSGALQRSEPAGTGVRDDIVITAVDRDRLRELIRASRDARDRDATQALADELDRAQIVPPERIAGNVVTMNSRIVFEDESTGERHEVSLVYPEESDPAQGRLSVLAPVGTALLGLSAGQTIDWPLPLGELKRYRVVKIVYQPEGAGQPTR